MKENRVDAIIIKDSIIQVVGIVVDRKIYMSAIKNVYQYINCHRKQKLLQYYKVQGTFDWFRITGMLVMTVRMEAKNVCVNNENVELGWANFSEERPHFRLAYRLRPQPKLASP